jgi:hypothetical protein
MRVEENSELTAAQSVLGRPKSASPFSNRGFILPIPSGRGMNRIVVRVRIEIRQTFRYPASERRIEPCEDRGEVAAERQTEMVTHIVAEQRPQIPVTPREIGDRKKLGA